VTILTQTVEKVKSFFAGVVRDATTESEARGIVEIVTSDAEPDIALRRATGSVYLACRSRRGLGARRIRGASRQRRSHDWHRVSSRQTGSQGTGDGRDARHVEDDTQMGNARRSCG
jgi:hypothetical protein